MGCGDSCVGYLFLAFILSPVILQGFGTFGSDWLPGRSLGLAGKYYSKRQYYAFLFSFNTLTRSVGRIHRLETHNLSVCPLIIRSMTEKLEKLKMQKTFLNYVYIFTL